MTPDRAKKAGMPSVVFGRHVCSFLFLFHPREGQQFPDAPVDMLFNGGQTFLRQVDGRVPGEAKADQAAKLVALLRAHDLPTDCLVGDAVRIGARPGIFFKVLHIIGHGVVEERKAVIKNRRRAEDLPGMVITQDTKVAEMSVLIIDHRIEHQHAFQLVGGLFANALIEIQASLYPAASHDPTYGNIGSIYVGEEPALRRQNVLPVFQIIVNNMQSHAFGDLTGIVFAVRFAPGIGRALGAALV